MYLEAGVAISGMNSVIKSSCGELLNLSIFSHQWLLDKQDLMRERSADLKVLSEEEYQKIIIFFANCMSASCVWLHYPDPGIRMLCYLLCL